MIERIMIIFLLLMFSLGYSKEIGMIVVEEEIKVYEYPCTSSNIIKNLEAGSFVVYNFQLEDRKLASIYFDWLYIDTLMYKNPNKGGERLFGWIKKEGVATPDEFERVTNFESFKVRGWSGDSYYDYEFYKNGTYIRYNEERKKIHGKVYNKGKVFLARDSIPTESNYLYNLFVLDNEGYYTFFCEDEKGELVRIKSQIYTKTCNWNNKNKLAILTGDNVNLRSGPGTNYEVLRQLRKGERVKVLEVSQKVYRQGEQEGLWVYVETERKDNTGKVLKGWLVDIYLKPVDE